MNCPKCGERTYVENSRHADSVGYRINQSLINVAEHLVSWYTRDWVVRKRVCKDLDCGFQAISVELLAIDLEEIMNQITQGHGPKLKEREDE